MGRVSRIIPWTLNAVTCVLIRRSGGDLTDNKGAGNVKMELREIEDTGLEDVPLWPQVKECQQSPEARRGKEFIIT